MDSCIHAGKSHTQIGKQKIKINDVAYEENMSTVAMFKVNKVNS